MKLSASVADQMSASPSKQGRQPRNDLTNETDDQDHQTGKENKGAILGNGKGKRKASVKASTRSTRAASKKAHCLCKRPEDGRPMVNCSECRVWSVLTSRPIFLLLILFFEQVPLQLH